MWGERQFCEMTGRQWEEEFRKGVPASREKLPWRGIKNSLILWAGS